jgi:hypothetical protein
VILEIRWVKIYYFPEISENYPQFRSLGKNKWWSWTRLSKFVFFGEFTGEYARVQVFKL